MKGLFKKKEFYMGVVGGVIIASAIGFFMKKKK